MQLLRTAGDPDDREAAIVRLDCWRGERLGDPRRDRRGVAVRVWRAVIARTGLDDAEIAAEVDPSPCPLITAGVVALWRAGRCLPDSTSCVVLLCLAGNEGIDALRSLTLL